MNFSIYGLYYREQMPLLDVLVMGAESLDKALYLLNGMTIPLPTDHYFYVFCTDGLSTHEAIVCGADGWQTREHYEQLLAKHNATIQ